MPLLKLRASYGFAPLDGGGFSTCQPFAFICRCVLGYMPPSRTPEQCFTGAYHAHSNILDAGYKPEIWDQGLYDVVV